MNRAKALLVLTAFAAATFTASPQAQTGSAPQAMELSLMDCIREAFKNNTQIQIDSYLTDLRETDLMFQMAQFDADVTSTVTYRDTSDPSLTFNQQGETEAIGSKSDLYSLNSRYTDPLRIGGTFAADLTLTRTTIDALNFGFISFTNAFPENYISRLELSYTQSLLRGFGKDINETQITIASTNQEIDRQDFRTRVQIQLMEVEDAYWTLVYHREDLEVRQEALALAQELLRLNRIRVDVGTLPPIDITQAEAGVASREEAVIIAQNNIAEAEDRLRRVMGMDPKSPEWQRQIVPSQDLQLIEREVNLSQEQEKAIANRTDLESARLRLRNADQNLAFQKNQSKWRLDVTGRYILQGRFADNADVFVTDPNTGAQILVAPANDDPGIQDAMEQLLDRDFPTYEVAVTLGIPIGNRAAEANYSRSRLERERAGITYADLEQAAIVQVGVAARRVQTDRKRIDAAEKNRILQEKTVEAEQKKFENGLSTSFQVLEFQRDLAEARSAENLAKRDYRISLANLDLATGVLEQTYNINIADYSRE